MKQVLQKLIAQAGFCSRHEAEKIIASGQVFINGKRAKLGDRAETTDEIMIGSKKLSFVSEFTYIKLNKPLDYVCTTRVFPGEKNIFSLVKIRRVLSIVGRLDKDSEGLVILTDDGDLAYRLTHPKFGVRKVYLVTLAHDTEKTKQKEIINKFYQGVNIGNGDGVVKAEKIKHLRGRTFEVILEEGKKRQIRRMFRVLNCQVARLIRVRIGSVTIGSLKRGEWKYLNKEEIRKLKT